MFPFDQRIWTKLVYDSTAVLKNRSNILIINGEQKGISENLYKTLCSHLNQGGGMGDGRTFIQRAKFIPESRVRGLGQPNILVPLMISNTV